MRIRDSRPDDWPAVWAFAKPVIESGEHFVWEPGTPEDLLREHWIGEREAPSSSFVAEVDGRVCGVAEIHPNQKGRGSHIANAGFMVDPEARGKGIGRALGEAAIARAKADGFTAMQFNAVVATNTAAVALWHSLGFRTLALLPATFRHPTEGLVDMHLMFREL
ncbi:GNAT family N-acetyltransferase [Glycomyces albidus]|uniref:GNAT family N-acetyltransferase n=1 Tax=Glycomyces albidus TaxID=2656774 RepID=A0A6L5G4B9_9ACTN|nr:GNAT family N-acetyltransferase [Glycomyces albidus]MQM24493.1 GNAT family N-acetyltransferase [Glycomyces albidus]